MSFYVLDVFTDRKLTGNPLAIVMNPGWLTTETMQAIARETNLSETTFVERREAEVERREGVRVRIFTTQEELPFAGHPTLGTASLLRSVAPESMLGDTMTLALNVGPIAVRFEAGKDRSAHWPMRGEMTQRDPEFGEVLDPRTVASLIGLAVDDFHESAPIQIVSTGTAFAIVPLRSAEALSRLRVRQEEASLFLRARGARWFYALGPQAGQGQRDVARGIEELPRWRARMQFNGGEDPATGSAAGCAISHLVDRQLVDSGQEIYLSQGVEIGRPSEIRLSALIITDDATNAIKITNVRVGGSTVLVASGHLFLP